MKWSCGVSSDNWVSRDRQILGILAHFPSARALKFLRQKNLIHRDIKPQVPPSTPFAYDD